MHPWLHRCFPECPPEWVAAVAAAGVGPTTASTLAAMAAAAGTGAALATVLTGPRGRVPAPVWVAAAATHLGPATPAGPTAPALGAAALWGLTTAAGACTCDSAPVGTWGTCPTCTWALEVAATARGATDVAVGTAATVSQLVARVEAAGPTAGPVPVVGCPGGRTASHGPAAPAAFLRWVAARVVAAAAAAPPGPPPPGVAALVAACKALGAGGAPMGVVAVAATAVASQDLGPGLTGDVVGVAVAATLAAAAACVPGPAVEWNTAWVCLGVANALWGGGQDPRVLAPLMVVGPGGVPALAYLAFDPGWVTGAGGVPATPAPPGACGVTTAARLLAAGLGDVFCGPPGGPSAGLEHLRGYMAQGASGGGCSSPATWTPGAPPRAGQGQGGGPPGPVVHPLGFSLGP